MVVVARGIFEWVGRRDDLDIVQHGWMKGGRADVIECGSIMSAFLSFGFLFLDIYLFHHSECQLFFESTHRFILMPLTASDIIR